MTCNVVLGLLFPSLNLTFMGHFPGNSDFLKYITLPLTLPDGRNETWLLCGEALTGKEQEGAFLDTGNFIFLDPGDCSVMYT